MTPERCEELREQIRAYYRGDDIPGGDGDERPTGGSLHVVLDDGNVRDADVWFCYGYAAALNDEAGVAIARALIPLTEAERERVVVWEPDA